MERFVVISKTEKGVLLIGYHDSLNEGVEYCGRMKRTIVGAAEIDPVAHRGQYLREINPPVSGFSLGRNARLA